MRNNDRLWVIGNGPSLAETPLDLLINEDTLAMNHINLMWEKVDTSIGWRPKFYMCIDWHEHNTEWSTMVLRSSADAKWSFLWDGFRTGEFLYFGNVMKDQSDAMGSGLGDLPRTTWVPRCDRHHYYGHHNNKSVREWHLPELCTAVNGISLAMQLGEFIGYKEVYLIGCDMGYENGKVNNFHKDYQMWEDPRDLAELMNGATLYSHEMAHRSSSIPIYNATIGGELEVHPRVDFYEVLNG